MIDRIMALLATATLAAFLGVLVWKVPRGDLIAVTAITMVLVIWDFLANAGKTSRRR